MNMTRTYSENFSVLKPNETQVVVDGWFIDTEHLLEPDADEVYSFIFAPWSRDDYDRIKECVDTCRMHIDMRSGPYSEKSFTFAGETKEGFIKCTQMFKPKLNIEAEHWSELVNKHASFNLWLNDDKTGRVYVNAAYVDVYANGSADLIEDSDLDTSDYDDLF
jgi:hypothetical protein